jgi:hypothetical protein
MRSQVGPSIYIAGGEVHTMTRRRKTRKERAKQTPPDGRDYGTIELRQQIIAANGALPIVQEGNDKHVRNMTQFPIDYYYRQGFMDQRQWESAQRLYRLWYYGAEQSRYTLMRLVLPTGGEMANPAEAAEAYRAAMNALLPDKIAYLIVYGVVCIGDWASYIQAAIPRYRRMSKLLDGLTALADHFHIPKYSAPKTKPADHRLESKQKIPLHPFH